jgi:hypothetical protein
LVFEEAALFSHCYEVEQVGVLTDEELHHSFYFDIAGRLLSYDAFV